MSIEPQAQVISVAGASLVASGHGYVVGLIANESMSQLYGVFKDSGGAFAWKRIDITNPNAPAVYAWTPTDTALPAPSANSHQNCFFYDAASGKTYGVFVDGGALNLLRISMDSGLVEYSTATLQCSSGSTVLGVVLVGTSLLALVKTITGTVVLLRWSLASVPSWSTLFSTSTEVAYTHLTLVSQGTQPVPTGMCLTTDNNALVFYGTPQSCSKYNTSNCAFSGSTQFTGTDLGVFFNRNGYAYQTNDLFSDVSAPGLVLHKWLDRSTAVISQEKSTLNMPDRLVQIGENTSVPLTYQARDGFGAQLSSLAGALCRFTIVTNRGIVDGDDASISTSAVGPFRDGNDVPLNRQVDVPLDGNGSATAYFQSARRSAAQDVQDTIRVIVPAQ